jgi:hypothetical protein
MLGMLRRARERREERERNCPCKQTCDCHRPQSGPPMGWILLGMLALFVGLIIFGPKPTPVRRSIHVGAKICDVVFVTTGKHCNGHGDCRSVRYDQAVCP